MSLRQHQTKELLDSLEDTDWLWLKRKPHKFQRQAAPPGGQQVEGLPFGGLGLPHPSSLSEFIESVFLSNHAISLTNYCCAIRFRWNEGYT